VSAVNMQRKQIYVKNKREPVPYDLLAICSGEKFVLPEIPGAKKNGVTSLYSLSDIKEFLTRPISDSVCVVGGNEWALSVSRVLASRRTEVKLLNDNSQITEIIGESETQAVKLSAGKIIGAGAVLFMSTLKGNTDFLKNADIEMADGHILVDERMRTSQESVFASGSVCRQRATASLTKSWDEVLSESNRLAAYLTEAMQG
jgi:NAD(P)H-nitrite reductase large subunit